MDICLYNHVPKIKIRFWLFWIWSFYIWTVVLWYQKRTTPYEKRPINLFFIWVKSRQRMFLIFRGGGGERESDNLRKKKDNDNNWIKEETKGVLQYRFYGRRRMKYTTLRLWQDKSFALLNCSFVCGLVYCLLLLFHYWYINLYY